MRNINKVIKTIVLILIIMAQLSGIVFAADIVTWNPVDKSINLELSNGNLTATGTRIVKATHGKESGKWYWEVKAISDNAYMFAGIANSNYSVDNDNLGMLSGAGATGYYFTHGRYAFNGVDYFGSPAVTSAKNDVVGIALDVDNKTIKWYKNGVLIFTENRLAQIQAPYFAAIAHADNVVSTVNFGSNPFEYPIPEGYKPYNEPQQLVTPPTAPTNLSAIGGNESVVLNWTPSSDATSYTVKKSTAAVGPFLEISSVSTGTTYTDTAVQNGITYYYVITAVNSGKESSDSNIASATPSESGRGILVIYMTNGVRKEFDLSKSEIDAFTNWYENKSTGVVGTPSTFALNINSNVKPFTKKTNIIIFNNVYDIEVHEYKE